MKVAIFSTNVPDNLTRALHAWSIGADFYDLDNTSVGATDLSPYDAFVVYAGQPNVSDVRAAIDNGTPALIGGIWGTTPGSDTAHNGLSTRLDFTGDLTTDSGIDEVDITDASHPITEFAGSTGRLQTRAATRTSFGVNGGTYVGQALAHEDPDASFTGETVIAIEEGTDDLTGAAIGDRVVILPLFPTSTNHTYDGAQLIREALYWAIRDFPDFFCDDQFAAGDSADITSEDFGDIALDNDRDLALVTQRGDPGALHIFDISNPDDIQKLSTLQDGTDLDDPYRIDLDQGRDLALLTANDAAGSENNGFGKIACVDYSDASAPVIRSVVAPTHNSQLSYCNVHADLQLALVGGTDYTGPDSIDYSNPDSISEVDAASGNIAGPGTRLQRADNLVLMASRGTTEIEVYEYTDSGTFSKGTDLNLPDFADDFSAIYDAAGKQYLFGRKEANPSNPTLFLVDYSDPANPSRQDVASYENINTIATLPDVSPEILVMDRNGIFEKYDISDLANVQQIKTIDMGWAGPISAGMAYDSDDRLWMAHKSEGVDGSNQPALRAFTTSETKKPPAKPDIFIDAVADEGADLSSSTYSHPNGVSHQDSRWQVRQQTASDWTNPEYDSGWTSTDLEAHTATPLPSGDDLEARVAHRDTNGKLSWSDPKTFSTTSQLESSRGPEGFFLGESGGNRLLEFGESYRDAGSIIIGRSVLNALAPAGALADHLFTNLYITFTYESDISVTVIPEVDGTEVQSAKTVFTRSYGGVQVTETVEVALTKTHDRGAGPLSSQHLRGTWFRPIIELEDTFGSGGYVSIDGVELEFEVLRESTVAAGG